MSLGVYGLSDYLSLVGIILTGYVSYYYYRHFTRVNPLPGPLPFPFVGNLPQILWHGGNFKKFFDYNHKKYGNIFDVYLGKTRNVILNRAEYSEKLLSPSTKNPYFLNLHYTEFEDFNELECIGNGLLLNYNYESWKLNRQFFTQALLTPKFTDRAIELTNEIFNELENYWYRLYLKEENIKEDKNILDFSVWLNNFTNDMIVKLITGERSYTMAAYFNTQSDVKTEHPTAVIDDSVKLVHAVRKFLLGLFFFKSVPAFIRHYVPFFKSISDDIINHVRFMNQKLDSLVKRRRQEIENTPLDEPLPNDMLTSLITANTPRDINYTKTVGGKAMRPMNDKEIRGNIFDGWLGGTDTTANSISFIVYHLAHNPDIKKKMLKEIDEIFQGDKIRPLTVNDFYNLKYCEAVVKEVSRVFPVISTLSRCNDNPDEIAGYQWPAGITFRINNDAIYLNEDYWVEPNKFNPDRWLVENFEPKKCSFNMFGGGLRLCPGRKLAMIELVSLIALLFRKYEIDLVDMNAPLKITSSTLNVCNELLVKIKPRI